VPTDETTPLGPNAEPGADAGVEDIQRDIEKTRHELGQTVEALAAKADVKGRAKEKAADTKDRLTEKATAVQSAAREVVIDDAGSVKPLLPVAAAIATGIAIIGLVVWRRRRR
jgi:ElaB/YqjD/DUF883 family membrane-anchored ribosome-binding protein